jgi:hypothetical protein
MHVKIIGIDSNLNLLLILKGLEPSRKNLINSPKISLDLIFTKMNLVGHTCMQEFELQHKCQKTLFE